MENNWENLNLRFRNLLKEVYDSLEPKFVSLEKRTHSMKERITLFQPELTKHIIKLCKAEYVWIENNSVQYEHQGQISVDFKDEVKEEAQGRLDIFNKCASEHNFGVDDYLMHMKKQLTDFKVQNKMCIDECVSGLHSNSDSDLKSCFNQCTIELIDSSDFVLSTLSTKIDDVEQRF